MRHNHGGKRGQKSAPNRGTRRGRTAGGGHGRGRQSGQGPPSQEEEPGTRSAPGEQRPLRVARGAGSAARWAGDARKAERAPRAEPRAGAAGPGEGQPARNPEVKHAGHPRPGQGPRQTAETSPRNPSCPLPAGCPVRKVAANSGGGNPVCQ